VITAMLLVALPLLGALAALTLGRRAVLLALLVAATGTALGAWMAFSPAAPSGPLWHDFLAVDPTARLFVLLINLIFLGVVGHVWSRVREVPELQLGIERFIALALTFLAAANLSVLSNHLLLGWLALEATSLAAAPMVARPGTPSAVRAAWGYFLFSSVGLGITSLGFACLARSLEASGLEPVFFLDHLRALAATPTDPWREVGLALVIVGYGTKLGLAPMYSWLPAAYDEAPPSVTAMLAGVQFNCALVGLLRILQIYRGGDARLVSVALLGIGLASMAVSTFSIITTHNYKRLLAYASINHGGVIAIGLGLGGPAAYGLVLYVVSNAFIKAILFLSAGKVDDHYRTKDMREVSGLIKDLPVSGLFLTVGTFALLGFPPFGSFLGELLILSELMRGRYVLVFVAFCALLTVTFVATGRSIFPMIWGEPKKPAARQGLLAAPIKLVFVAALVTMGVYLPRPVSALFVDVAASLGGGR
jgi:hydrogenase-4 component F